MMATPIHPFPGLRPFKTEEQYLFFGREGHSEEVIRRLRQGRFLALIGTSGSGKSSLIRAGLLPALYGGFMAGAGSRWRVATFRPGVDPIGRLALALCNPKVLYPDIQPGERERDAMLQEAILRGSGLGLIEAVKLARLPAGDNLLIIVDQLEELFRFEKAATSTRQEDDAAAFVKLLLEATAQTELPIYVVVAIRSDFIGDCARFRKLPEAVTSGLYLIPWMSREQQRKAIVSPVEVAGGAITARLVTQLLSDSGDNPDQLPILQHALMRTWDYRQGTLLDPEHPLDLDDYLAIGGMEHALSLHANKIYDDLPNKRIQFVAKMVFKAITEKGADKRGVRRPVAVDIVAKIVGTTIPEEQSVAEVLTVANHFGKDGFLVSYEPMSTGDNECPILDISHESLINGWDKLRGWVEDEHESSRIYKRLADRAEQNAKGYALPMVDPELQLALDWEKMNQPNVVWAQRYDPNFDHAIGFLRLSETKARENREADLLEQIQETEKRETELRSTRKQVRDLRIAFAVAFVCFCAAIYLAYSNHREQEHAYWQENHVLDFEINTLNTLGKITVQQEDNCTLSALRNGTNARECSSAITPNYGQIFDMAAETGREIRADTSSNLRARVDAGKLEAAALAYSDHIDAASATSDTKKDELRKKCIDHLEAGTNTPLAGDARDIVSRILLTASSADVLYRLGDHDPSRRAAETALERILLILKDQKPEGAVATEWRSLAVSIGAIQGILDGKLNFDPSEVLQATAERLEANTIPLANNSRQDNNGPAKRQTTSSSERTASTSVIESIADLSSLNSMDPDLRIKLLKAWDALSIVIMGKADVWEYRVLTNLEVATTYASLARTSDVRKLSPDQRLSLMDASDKAFDRSDADLVAEVVPGDLKLNAIWYKRLSLRFRAQMKASRAALEHGAARQSDLQAAIDLNTQSLELYHVSNDQLPVSDPSQVTLLTELGRDYLLKGDTGKAEEIFQRVDASVPTAFAASDNDNAAYAYVSIRHAYDDQYALIAESPGIDKTAHIRSERAWTAKAISTFLIRRANAPTPELRVSADKAMAALYGGLSYDDLLLGDFKKAVAEGQHALALDKSQIWVMTNVAHGYLFQGRVDKAILIYRRYAAMPDRPNGTGTFRQDVEEDFSVFRKEQYPGINLTLIQQAEDKLAGTW